MYRYKMGYRLISLLAATSMLVLLTCCGGNGEVSPTTTYSDGQQISTISSPSGQVLIKKQGTDIWVEAVHGAKVEAGDEIKTGSDGFLMLILFDGSVIEIEADSEIAISELTVAANTGSTLIRLQQTIGNTLSRVQQLADPASSYEIETPAGTAAVRGTVLTVEVDDIGNTTVTSIEGRVWFTASGVTVVLDEGMQSSASPGGTPTIQQSVSTPAPILTPAATPVPTQSPGMTLGDMFGESVYLGPVSYDWVVTYAGQPSMTIKIWMENNRWRYEHSAGEQEVIQLVDYNAQTMYTYFPDQNMAYRTEFNQAPERPVEEAESYEQIQPTILGTETIDGKSCLVIEWTIEDITSKAWIWQERSFPIKMEQFTSQGTTIMLWQNIQFNDIPDSMFQLPAGVEIITFTYR